MCQSVWTCHVCVFVTCVRRCGMSHDLLALCHSQCMQTCVSDMKVSCVILSVPAHPLAQSIRNISPASSTHFSCRTFQISFCTKTTFQWFSFLSGILGLESTASSSSCWSRHFLSCFPRDDILLYPVIVYVPVYWADDSLEDLTDDTRITESYLYGRSPVGSFINMFVDLFYRLCI